ncbi:choice-of-anchor J domain-containing protein [Candidatus Fermentibacteria bacterium]|nr:choice-of-anchor J domain-containing protein [Candidatus Fermentibacteria bacterium]
MILSLSLALILNLGWIEGFEAVPYFPPDGWILVNADAYDAYWVPTQSTPHSGARSAVCCADFNSQNADYLITPCVMPRAETGDTLLSFWVRSTTAASCSIEVMISTAELPAPSSFTNLATWPVTQEWHSRSVSVGAFDARAIYCALRVSLLPSGQQVTVDDISLPAALPQPDLCNGLLRTRGEPAQQRLLVWGTHEEMGYAHGFLLAEQCLANMTRFVVGTTLYHWWTPTEYEGQVLPYFRTYFSIPAPFEEEATGLLAGVRAKGVSLFHPALARDITVEDILCSNAMGDFQGFNCSSNSGWGESTAADDTLEGGVVIARNFEFPTGQNATLGHTSLIIAFDPSDEDEQRTASVTFAGYFGCTSLVNEHGVGAFIDNGNYPIQGSITPGSLSPFGLSLRKAVEAAGATDVYGVATGIEHSTSRYAYDVHLVSPFDAAHPVPAAILEINNIADSLRFATNNGIAPPIASATNMVVTNHHRVLYPPVYCDRYEALACSLNANLAIDTQRAFRLQDSVAWWVPSYLAGTLHSIAVRPNVLVENPSWPCILVSYAHRWGGSHTRPRHAYSWDELFWRDAQAPAMIAGITVTPVNGDLLLAWSDPGDNVGVTEYRIYRSGAAFFPVGLPSLAGSTSQLQWLDPGAGQSVGVFYRVTARDASLNEGPPSPSVGGMGFALVVP